MRDDIADLVQSVFQTGLDFKDRLASGEKPDIHEVKKALLPLLNDTRLTELGGGEAGARFALVCWVDEIFIDDSAWGQEWSKNSLEYQLYRTQDGGHLFWDPGVKNAEAQPGNHTVEVFYLCILLGFRGDLRNHPDELRAWVDRLQPQVIRAYGDEPGRLDDSTPENYVPVLKGREKFQAMLKLWGAALLFALAALSVWIVFVFTGRR